MKLKENALIFLTNLEAEEFVQDNLYNEIKVTGTHNEFFIVDKGGEKILIDKACFESEKIEIPVRIVDNIEEEEEEEQEEEKPFFQRFKTLIIALIVIGLSILIIVYNQKIIKEEQQKEQLKQEIKVLDKYESYTLLDNDIDKEIDITLRHQEELKKQLQNNYLKIKELKIKKENILKSKINLTNEMIE